MWRRRIGRKSEEGILQGEGKEIVEVDLAKLSAISLPMIPECLGAQSNLMIKFVWWSEKRILFIWNTSGERQELKGLLISDWMHDIKSETISKNYMDQHFVYI